MHRHVCLGLAAALLALALMGCVADWSPDGKQLAVAWKKGDRSALALVNADGSGVQWIPGGEDAFFPAWSPDGRNVLFAVNKDGKWMTSIYDVSERTTRQIAGELGPPFAWRADGRRCAGFRELE